MFDNFVEMKYNRVISTTKQIPDKRLVPEFADSRLILRNKLLKMAIVLRDSLLNKDAIFSHRRETTNIFGYRSSFKNVDFPSVSSY